MQISTEALQRLRQETGVGMMEAKKVLESVNGDHQAAIEALRKRGAKMAAAKSERAVKDGAVGSYMHANNKVGALVAVACETDFVSRTDDFQSLAHELAVHVAAMNPKYIASYDVPADLVAKEEEIYREQLKAEGKPEAMWDKILPGKIAKYYSEVCLLNQPFVKDDSLTVEQFIQASIAKLGENIRVTGFSRISI